MHLLRPGDQPGPAGEIYLHWRRAVERPVVVRTLHRALPALASERIAAWLDAGQGGPVARAAAVLETVLAEFPRARGCRAVIGRCHPGAFIGVGASGTAFGCRAEAARSEGGGRRATVGVPKSGGGLSRRSGAPGHRLGETLVAPESRCTQAARKGGRGAVAQLLTRDAVAPSALASLNSDRAARRFCNRLVELGAVRELTGRDTFQLYGV